MLLNKTGKQAVVTSYTRQCSVIIFFQYIVTHAVFCNQILKKLQSRQFLRASALAGNISDITQL